MLTNVLFYKRGAINVVNGTSNICLSHAILLSFSICFVFKEAGKLCVCVGVCVCLCKGRVLSTVWAS